MKKDLSLSTIDGRVKSKETSRRRENKKIGWGSFEKALSKRPLGRCANGVARLQRSREVTEKETTAYSVIRRAPTTSTG
jgi:hypothetical protein